MRLRNKSWGRSAERHNVRSLGNDGHCAVAACRDAFPHGGGERLDACDAGEGVLCRIQSRAVELDCADSHRLELHLGLPFVDGGVGFEQDPAQKFARAVLDQSALTFNELRGSKPLRTLGSYNEPDPGARMSIGLTIPLTV